MKGMKNIEANKHVLREHIQEDITSYLIAAMDIRNHQIAPDHDLWNDFHQEIEKQIKNLAAQTDIDLKPFSIEEKFNLRKQLLIKKIKKQIKDLPDLEPVSIEENLRMKTLNAVCYGYALFAQRVGCCARGLAVLGFRSWTCAGPRSQWNGCSLGNGWFVRWSLGSGWFVGVARLPLFRTGSFPWFRYRGSWSSQVATALAGCGAAARLPSFRTGSFPWLRYRGSWSSQVTTALAGHGGAARLPSFRTGSFPWFRYRS